MSARWGVLVLVAGLLAGGCVDLRYPPGATRDGGLVVELRSTGQACLGDGECASGFCTDGVCCREKCGGPCKTCRKDDNFGVCFDVEVDLNPRGLCKDDGCAQVAKCDGSGACQKRNKGEACAPTTCTGATLTLAGRCDDQGVCVPGTTQSCAPYLCGAASQCNNSCTTRNDCSNGSNCVDGMCGKKGLGTPCVLDTECLDGICASGVCCKTTCAGPCRSCALEGSAGTCTPVPSGAPPTAQAPNPTCDSEPASTCGLDGTCDGAGNCRLHVAGKTCAPASCANASLKPAGTCDGKGKCQMPTATVTCGGYTCASPTTCRTTCNVDAECASPAICGGTKDAACGGLSAQYFRQTNLTDLAFMRTDARIEFDWGGGSPNPLLNVDNFSVRWKGKITARFTETYTFYVGSDDGERLWVGGALIIDRFTRHASVPEDVSKTVNLTAGQPVDIQLEYFENGGDSNVRMLWYSKSEPKAIVPTSALSPQ